jgi:hypothetical protein
LLRPTWRRPQPLYNNPLGQSGSMYARSVRTLSSCAHATTTLTTALRPPPPLPFFYEPALSGNYTNYWMHPAGRGDRCGEKARLKTLLGWQLDQDGRPRRPLPFWVTGLRPHYLFTGPYGLTILWVRCWRCPKLCTSLLLIRRLPSPGARHVTHKFTCTVFVPSLFNMGSS